MRRRDPLARHRLQAEQARRVLPAGNFCWGRRGRWRVRRRLLRRAREHGLPACLRKLPSVRRQAARGLLHGVTHLVPTDAQYLQYEHPQACVPLKSTCWNNWLEQDAEILVRECRPAFR